AASQLSVRASTRSASASLVSFVQGPRTFSRIQARQLSGFLDFLEAPLLELRTVSDTYRMRTETSTPCILASRSRSHSRSPDDSRGNQLGVLSPFRGSP